MLVFGTMLISISLYTHSRIAVCIDGPKRFAANARRLLGKEAIKQRHLKILGYEVVQVSVIALPCSTHTALECGTMHFFLFSFLSPYSFIPDCINI